MNRRSFLLTGSAGLLALRAARGWAAPAPETASATTSELFGVDYYPDQTSEHLWQQDAERMAAFGVTNVRIAEFAWALMEPAEGAYDFAWLDRAIGTLHAQNIGVILGTPSAAPPPWLTQKYPDIVEVDDHGMPLSPGARRFTCPTNKTYRGLSLGIATHMAQRYANTPGVIAWQIDNELTLGSSQRCYCRFCRAGFAAWLQAKYGSLQAMNNAWGDVFWSNVYTDWAQIPVPLPSGAPPNPGLALDYDRYQSFANVTFLGEQLRMLRQSCPKHMVTTNNVSLVDSINMRDLYRDLDFVASDNYPGFFAIQGGALAPAAIATTVSFSLDFSRSLKGGKPFFVMEQQSGKAGQPFFSPQPEPGQLRLWSFQAIAHGAFGLNYFRWDTDTAGAEEYWHGVLRHDRSPSPGYDELRRTVAEMKSLGHEALHAETPASLGLVFNYSSDWALTIQPGQPQLKYMNEALTWYGALAAAQGGVDVVDATGDLGRYKVVCAPAMYVVSPAQATAIRAYVRQGGTFIAGFRLGVKDEHSRIVDTPLPGLLRDVMGVTLEDYQPIYQAAQGQEKQSVAFSGKLAGALPAGDAPCRLWADILTPEGETETLATYTGAAYAGRAAITSHRFGKGRALYLGAGLAPETLVRLLIMLLVEAGVPRPVSAPLGVELVRRAAGGRVWTYLLNHTAAPQTVDTGTRCRDVLDGSLNTGSVALKPYGVRVLLPA